MPPKSKAEKKPKTPPKRKPRPKLDRAAAREQVLTAVQKRFGPDSVRTADEIPNIFQLRRPTGIPSLDVILRGGWPAGGPSHLIGEDGVGKTDLSWRTIAQVQKNYGDDAYCAMACIEHHPDVSQGRFAGAVLPYSDAEIAILQEEAGHAFTKAETEELKKEVGKVDFIYGETAENVLAQVIDCFASGAYQVIVLDSIGALEAAGVVETEMGGSTQKASVATLLTQFMKKLWPLCVRQLAPGIYNETTLLLLNQYKENVNMANPNSPKMRISGGRAVKHGKLVDLVLNKGPNIYDKNKPAGASRKPLLGKTVVAQILKGKAGLHEGGSTQWDFLHAVGVDIGTNLLRLGMQVGLVTLVGSRYSFHPSLVGEQGKSQLASAAAAEALVHREAIIQAAMDDAKVPPYDVI